MSARTKLGVLGLLLLGGCTSRGGTAGGESEDGVGSDGSSGGASLDAADMPTDGNGSVDGTGTSVGETSTGPLGTSTSGAATSSGSSSETGECIPEPVAVQPATFPVDVLVAVDASGSMNLEIASLGGQFPGFFTALHDLATVRAALVSPYPDVDPAGVCIGPPMGTDGCPSDDDNPPQYVHHPLALTSFGTLSGIIDSHATWSAHFRPNASLHVIVVSDDEPSTSALDFLADFAALAPGYDAATIHGMFAVPGAPNCFDVSEESLVYEELVDTTGGVAHDLCSLDATTFFAEVSSRIASQVAPECHYALDEVPADPELLAVFADGMVVPRLEDERACGAAGWYYVDAQTIALCPVSCDIEGNITAQAGCAR